LRWVLRVFRVFRDEVAVAQAQVAEQVEDLLQLTRLVPAEAELGRHQVPGGPLHQHAALGGDLGQPAAAVGRVGVADHQPLTLQAADDVRDAGRVHHQPLADHAQRQRAAAAEREQDQGFVPREGQPVGPQQRVQFAEQDLLGAHDRGDGGHRGRRAEPGLPDPGRPVDGIERQLKGFTHASNRISGGAPFLVFTGLYRDTEEQGLALAATAAQARGAQPAAAAP
jgi:hypothetical protein